MAKDFKEKYERVCSIKDRAISLVESQLNGNIENVDAKELGEVADIAKDMAELMELCAEAEYYHSITEAMEKNSDAENRMQMDKYLPEAMYYGGNNGKPPIIYAGGMNGGMNSGSNGNSGARYYMPIDYDPEERERMRDWGYNNPMRPHYYTDVNVSTPSRGVEHTSMSSGEYMRDAREGRAGITRKTYMEMKEEGADKSTKMKEMEKFIHDLADDVNEMIEGLEPSEKATVKTKLAQLAAKIV